MKVSVLLSLFRCEKYLADYFENALAQIGFDKIEFSIIHNDPTKKEKAIIENYKSKLNIVYQDVKREPLYKSWNRAIKQSTGEYLVCWNVDDLRTKDSISRMVKTLEDNYKIGFTYGDFIITKKFGATKGKYINTPEYNFNLATTGAIGGPFFMWRRNLIPKVGYFDEQFLSGGDFDYTVRLAVFSVGSKTKGLIGYFLNENLGLSTKNNHLQILEREVILRRYGVWQKTNLFLNTSIISYQINHIREFDNLRELNDQIQKLVAQRKKDKIYIFFSTFKEQMILISQKIKRLF